MGGQPILLSKVYYNVMIYFFNIATYEIYFIINITKD